MNSFYRTGLHVALSLASAFAPLTHVVTAAHRPGCVDYEPDTITLQGVIERKTFPGPPNYESVAQGDAAERYWLLRVEHPFCVTGSREFLNQDRDGVRVLQLVFMDDADYQRYRPLVGHAVHATGTLFGAQTGHHHTDVLLTVGKLEAFSQRSP